MAAAGSMGCRKLALSGLPGMFGQRFRERSQFASLRGAIVGCSESVNIDHHQRPKFARISAKKS